MIYLRALGIGAKAAKEYIKAEKRRKKRKRGSRWNKMPKEMIKARKKQEALAIKKNKGKK